MTRDQATNLPESFMHDESIRTVVLELSKKGLSIRRIAEALEISRGAVEEIIRSGEAQPPKIIHYDTLRFWIHGGDTGGQQLRVMLADADDNLIDTVTVPVTPQAGTWSQVDVPLSAL